MVYNLHFITKIYINHKINSQILIKINYFIVPDDRNEVAIKQKDGDKSKDDETTANMDKKSGLE